MSTFKVGDIVEWTSSARGVTKTKRGKVVEVVEEYTPGPDVGNDYIHGQRAGEFALETDFAGDRDHESYLVSVPQEGKRWRRKPALYWPRVSKLRKVPSREELQHAAVNALRGVPPPSEMQEWLDDQAVDWHDLAKQSEGKFQPADDVVRIANFSNLTWNGWADGEPGIVAHPAQEERPSWSAGHRHEGIDRL